MAATDPTTLSDGTSLYQWERPSSAGDQGQNNPKHPCEAACTGTVGFITFFSQLQQGGPGAALAETEGEADKVTFPLSPEEYQDLLDLLLTEVNETHDAPDTSSTARQKQLQKLQQQLQQYQRWQISVPDLARLISYITTQIRIPGFLGGPLTLRYSSALRQLEMGSPRQSPIHREFRNTAGKIFQEAVQTKLTEALPGNSLLVNYIPEYYVEMSDGDHRQVDVWLDCARLPPGTDYNRIPILAIKVDFTHETGDQEIRFIQKYCREKLRSDFVWIIRLNIEKRVLSERRKNPNKPYRVTADLIAVDSSRGLDEPLQEVEYVLHQRVICAGDGSGSGSGNGNGNSNDNHNHNEEEEAFLYIPLDLIDDSIPMGTCASIPCEKLRSAFAQAVEKQNEADRRRPSLLKAEGDGARTTSRKDNLERIERGKAIVERAYREANK